MANKETQAYFNKIGLWKVKDIESEISTTFKDKATEYIEEYQQILKDREEKDKGLTNDSSVNISRQKDLVDFTNKNRKMALLFASAYDVNVYEHFFELIASEKREMGPKILDFGCGPGIITCYIARIMPRCQIVGVDESDNAIKVANEIKERLKLKNVSFLNSSELKDKDFDTLISVRTFHENVPILLTNESYYPFKKVLDETKQKYIPYINNLSSYLKPNGKMICLERGDNLDLVYICTALRECGFGIDLKKYRKVVCKEYNEDRSLLYLVSTKNGSNEGFEKKLRSLVYEKNLYGCEGVAAISDIDTVAGDLIDGFITIDSVNTISGFHALFDYKNNPNDFVLYQRNKLTASLQIFSKDEDMDEANDLMQRMRAQDTAAGFVCKDIKSYHEVSEFIDKYKFGIMPRIKN